jgi:hypothetical protein
MTPYGRRAVVLTRAAARRPRERSGIRRKEPAGMLRIAMGDRTRCSPSRSGPGGRTLSFDGVSVCRRLTHRTLESYACRLASEGVDAKERQDDTPGVSRRCKTATSESPSRTRAVASDHHAGTGAFFKHGPERRGPERGHFSGGRNGDPASWNPRPMILPIPFIAPIRPARDPRRSPA